MYFTIFPQYNYTCDGKLDAGLFLLYFSGIYKTFNVFENSSVFNFIKVLSVLNFLIIKEKITFLCKIKYYHVRKLQKFKYTLFYKNQ